ncbi:MAG: IS66 family transposase [bacterium]|nr:IS66 family transposase [bacterium]
MSVRLETETDIEHLRKVALMQDSELRRLSKQVVDLKRELAELKGEPMTQAELEGLFESELEKLSAAQPAPTPKSPKREPKKRTKFGPRDQSGLEQLFEHHKLHPADLACPECGEELQAMAGQFDQSQLVSVVQLKYVLVNLRLQKYRCAKGCCIDQPLAPQRATPGGRYSVEFAAKVAIDKYLNHLPLARQARMMAEHRLSISRNVLWSQVKHMGMALRPIWLALIKNILSQRVIGLDQTGWPNLERRSAKKWQMWCLTAPGMTAHIIRDDKGRETFDDLTAGFEGVVVCDMMSTHLSAEKGRAELTLAACWAHIRRKFAECEKDFPKARVALDHIRSLYDFDAEASGEEALREIRKTKSRDVHKALQGWLLATPMPKFTSLGKAIRHTLKHWTQLSAFLENPQIPLDNNATERALRGPVVGRRNHFGSKSRRGTETAAILYSVIETAKLAGVPVSDYLVEAVRASRDNHVLTPAAYKRHQACDHG